MKPGVVLAQVGLHLVKWLKQTGLDQSFPALQTPMALIRAKAHGYVDPFDQDYEEDYDVTPGILEAPEPLADAAQLFFEQIRIVLNELRETHFQFVFLLDGLDRMTDMPAFENLVRDDIRALRELGIGVVLVGPLRALYGIDRALLDLFERYHYQPWFDVKRDAASRNIVRTVLVRRAPKGVFEDEAIDRTVAYSGGVVRDLLALAQSACVEAYLQGAEVVGLTHVEASIEAFGRKHMQGLRPDELEVLRRLSRGGGFVQTSENDLGLLMTRRVLEYRGKDEQPRYVVHPTIERFVLSL